MDRRVRWARTVDRVALELRQLRSFLTLAEELNFTAAARRLHVTQQALSRLVQQMEREVGVPLFTRTTRSVAPTAAGAAMVPVARRAVGAADRAVVAARRAHTGARSALRVDVSSGSLDTGARILRSLRADHPEVAVHLVEVGPVRGLRSLLDGELDVLLGLVPHCPPDLVAETVRREPVLLGVARDHPLAARATVPVAALADEELLLPADETDGGWVALVHAACRAAGVEPRRWPGTTYGSQAAADVVREGRCVVPTATWAQRPSGVVFRPLVDPVPVLPWSVVVRAEDVDRPEVAAFRATARSVAAERRWSRAGRPPSGAAGRPAAYGHTPASIRLASSVARSRTSRAVPGCSE